MCGGDLFSEIVPAATAGMPLILRHDVACCKLPKMYDIHVERFAGRNVLKQINELKSGAVSSKSSWAMKKILDEKGKVQDSSRMPLNLPCNLMEYQDIAHEYLTIFLSTFAK